MTAKTIPFSSEERYPPASQGAIGWLFSWLNVVPFAALMVLLWLANKIVPIDFENVIREPEFRIRQATGTRRADAGRVLRMPPKA